MRAVEEMMSCQISFCPIGSADFSSDVNRVLEVIRSSGLDHQVGVFSTVVRGEKDRVFNLTREIYQAMEKNCGFVMDVKFSNLCGCPR